MNKNITLQPQQKNNNTTQIGQVEIKSNVALAPMAGITDLPLRQLIRKFSPNCLLTTEMISSEMLMQNRPDEHEKIKRPPAKQRSMPCWVFGR